MLGMFTLISSRYCLARRRIFCLDSQRRFAKRSVLTVEEQVEVYGQLWDKGEVLVNGFDAMGTGFLNRPEPHLFALEEDLARVRPVETRQVLTKVLFPAPLSPTRPSTSPR